MFIISIMKESYENFYVYEYKPHAKIKQRQLPKEKIVTNTELSIITIRTPLLLSSNFYISFPYIFNELVNFGTEICEFNGYNTPSIVFLCK